MNWALLLCAFLGTSTLTHDMPQQDVLPLGAEIQAQSVSTKFKVKVVGGVHNPGRVFVFPPAIVSASAGKLEELEPARCDLLKKLTWQYVEPQSDDCGDHHIGGVSPATDLAVCNHKRLMQAIEKTRRKNSALFTFPALSGSKGACKPVAMLEPREIDDIEHWLTEYRARRASLFSALENGLARSAASAELRELAATAFHDAQCLAEQADSVLREIITTWGAAPVADLWVRIDLDNKAVMQDDADFRALCSNGRGCRHVMDFAFWDELQFFSTNGASFNDDQNALIFHLADADGRGMVNGALSLSRGTFCSASASTTQATFNIPLSYSFYEGLRGASGFIARPRCLVTTKSLLELAKTQNDRSGTNIQHFFSLEPWTLATLLTYQSLLDLECQESFAAEKVLAPIFDLSERDSAILSLQRLYQTLVSNALDRVGAIQAADDIAALNKCIASPHYASIQRWRTVFPQYCNCLCSSDDCAGEMASVQKHLSSSPIRAAPMYDDGWPLVRLGRGFVNVAIPFAAVASEGGAN